MLNERTFARWEIWEARVYFEDSDESKIRPVLILNHDRAFVLSAPITSKPPRRQFSGEYAIQKWKEAGLNRPSTIRLSKMIDITTGDITNRLGVLHDVDKQNINRLLAELIKRGTAKNI